MNKYRIEASVPVGSDGNATLIFDVMADSMPEAYNYAAAILPLTFLVASKDSMRIFNVHELGLLDYEVEGE